MIAISKTYIKSLFWFLLLTLIAQQCHSLRRSVRQVSSNDPTCTPITGGTGRCVIVNRCRRLWNQKNWRLLRRSICGYAGNVPKICCPVTTKSSVKTTSTTTTLTSTSSPTTTLTTTVEIYETSQTMARQRELIILPNTTSSPSDINTSTSTPSSTTSVSIPSSTPSRSGRTIGSNVFPKECGKTSSSFRRIIGGQESSLHAWPWMAVLYLTRRGIKSAECGGTLITNKHVITAAHCTVNSRRGTPIDPSNLLVRLGDHNIESEDDGANPIDVTIRSVIKHEEFNLRTFQNDISILELTFSVEFREGIAPICLPYNIPDKSELVDRNAFAAGWGTTSFGGPASPTLQEVQLRIWRNSDCTEVFRRDVPITTVNLCAGDGDKDACRGDSGGPLMLARDDNTFCLIGIVSFGKKCGEPGVPGVYARVTSFLDWIETQVERTL